MKKRYIENYAQKVSAPYITGFPIRLYYASVEPFGAVPLHRHGELEFVLVQSGTLKLSLGADVIEFSEGQGVLINSGIMHSFGCSRHCSCTYIMFSDEFIAPSGSDISVKYVKPFVTNSSLSFIPFDDRYEWQGNVLKNIKRVISLLGRYSGKADYTSDDAFGELTESSCYELEVHTLMCGIWAELYSGLESAVRSSVSGNEYVAQRRTQLMVEYIHRNYRDSTTLDDIAASANISKSEAARCFQSCLHISPVAYLLRYRIEMAQQLLQNSGLTIEAVGLECGFSSASYFCKMFQRHTGISPGQFRNNSKNQVIS